MVKVGTVLFVVHKENILIYTLDQDIQTNHNNKK